MCLEHVRLRRRTKRVFFWEPYPCQKPTQPFQGWGEETLKAFRLKDLCTLPKIRAQDEAINVIDIWALTTAHLHKIPCFIDHDLGSEDERMEVHKAPTRPEFSKVAEAWCPVSTIHKLICQELNDFPQIALAIGVLPYF